MKADLILLGPILFAVVLTTLTIIKYDFLLSLGWDPINAPTFDWPSGLALGKYGFVMTATFIISGLLMFIFALRLKADLKPDSGLPNRVHIFSLFWSGPRRPGIHYRPNPARYPHHLAWIFT